MENDSPERQRTSYPSNSAGTKPSLRQGPPMSVNRPSRLRALLSDLAQGVVHLLYPGVCGACDRPLPPGEDAFCDRCRATLTTDPFASCPRCAGTVGPFVPLDTGCTNCRGQVFHFERVIRLGHYEGLLREVILRLKHAPGEILAENLGALWACHAEQALRQSGAELIVPVPLHWWRRWARGYNQSAALARALARRLGLPCRPDLLCRQRNTPPQTHQSATGRRVNVKGAFRARPHPSLRGRAVLLVDDVLTSVALPEETIVFTAADLDSAA
jgi:ComF family protein